MGKITALQLFKEVKSYLSEEWNDIEDLVIIESALKRIPKLEKALRLEIENSAQLNNERIKDLKKLKGLEIIKEHRLNIDWFLQFVKQDINYEIYVMCIEESDNEFAKRFILNKEEYDLLKEALK